jgi:predicted ATPase
MEAKKFWVRSYKSLRDVTIEFSTKLTIIAGPSGSGKTALVEAFEVLRNAQLPQASVGIEVWYEGCRVAYEVRDKKKAVITDCNVAEVDKAVEAFINNIVVIKDINWKAVRSLQPVIKEERLLPDASNFVPFLYTATGGVPDLLVEPLKYVLPTANDLQFLVEGGMLILKLTTEDGAALTQATMPSGALKTLIIETALMMRPTMIVIDEFENSLYPEAQQFLIDELRSRGVYAVLTTHSTVVLDYVKSPKEVVMLRLADRETKAWRLGSKVEEMLKRHKLTLSELIESGLLEPLVF